MLTDSDWSEEESQEEDLAFESDSDVKDQRSSAPHSAWTVLEPEQLAQAQDVALASTTGILGCSTADARTLLIHFRWNTETLFGVLAERGQEHVCKLAGCSLGSEQEGHEQASASADPGEEITCGTCFCEVPRSEGTQMQCGHFFCNNCWQQHLKIQVSEGKSRRLPCMGVRCGVTCDEAQVKRLLANDAETLDKYMRSLLESYIEDNAMVRWCPSVPSCGRAIRVDGDQHCEPECSCGERFCFACGDSPHSPCTCDMWHKWRQKCVDDSETHNWLSANSKPCPKCAKLVEKNGGCNLVYCMCGQAFCWLCGQPTGRAHTWERIDGHSCGRFKEDADSKISTAARNIKRFQHYQQRWEAHMASQRAEAELREKVGQNIEQSEAQQTTLADYSWLTQALDQLCEARRILGYSYAYAFYMFGNDMFAEEVTAEQNQVNQNLFEDQQQMLESEVEKLAGQVQTPADQLMSDKQEGLRLEVINCAVGIDKRFVKMYDLIENDLLGQLQFSASYVAPYKGQSTLRSVSSAPHEVQPSSLANTARTSASQSTVIDLTEESPSSARRRAESPAKRQRMHHAHHAASALGNAVRHR